MSLIASAVLVFATGLMHSKYILGFLEISGDMAVRQIHSTAAYWMLVLASVHLGLHWDALSSKIRLNSPKIRRITGLAALALAAFGVWSWMERGMTEKLFMGYSFDFWNPESPQILFFAENFGIMGLAAAVSSCALKSGSLLKNLKNWKHENTNE